MLEPVPLPDADVRYDPHWLGADEAGAMFDALYREIGWENHPVRLFGRELPAPRLSCWIGDPGTAYRYSGVVREPRPWTPALAGLRARLRATLGLDFDAVLANLYRDGRDAMGWHSDDEPELGAEPVIASVSLGGTRRFLLRHRDRDVRQGLALAPGSLLLMQGTTQRHYRHSLPRTARPVAPRINLTFRRLGALR
ncbi:alpha-ketoglutarate-dependent dioxygenase AlkB family protein [Lysobacter xanthus]